MRLSCLLLAALLAPVACSSSPARQAQKPAVDSGADSGTGGYGGFLLDGGFQCVDAGQDATEAGSCTPSSTSVSFSADISPILHNRCSGEVCHGSTGWGDYSVVTKAHSRECCDGRSLVVPGSPDDSYIIHKLRGQGMCQGVRMPRNSAPLPASQIQEIYDWICMGAKNN